jgi:spore germination cell wall hydrolase CwlJ-like protein
LAYHIQTRARTRVLLATSSIGLIIGAAMGSTWLGTYLAREASLHDQAQRMISIAESDLDKDHFLNMSAFGFNKPKGSALTSLADLDADEIDPGAMAIAMRYDPSRAPQTQGHDRSAIVLAQNLMTLKHTPDGRKWGRMSAPASQTPVVQASMTMGAFEKPDFEKSILLKPKITSASPFASKIANKTDNDCLTQAVYYEARGEGEAGMRAVAQVILNRVRHPAYPKTICGVVYQGAMQSGQGSGCQFSFTCNGTMRNRLEVFAWKRAKTIATDALGGYVMKAVGTSTHFHTTYVNPGWAGHMDRIATIGDHVFYQYRGASARMQLAADKVRPSSPEDQRTVTNLPAPDGNVILAATSAPAAAPQPLAASSEVARTDLIQTLDRQQPQATQPRAMTVGSVVTGPEARQINDALAQPEKPAAQ